ncbi:MAG: hypothetical protein KDK62_03225 [Chlamydiia bacterium]|nr:hypothetical protein [Chlamydiia bacterium]
MKDNLKKTKAGDYIVAAQGKMLSILRVASHKDGKMLLDEISAPLSCQPPSFRQWVIDGAPGHTSWVLYNIDLDTGAIEKAYSYTRGTYFQVSDAENFLGTLLTLRLEPIPDNRRKLIGPPPTGGPDFRKVWQPKLVVDGTQVSGVKFSAWSTFWPCDHSELSGKSIVVYLPENANYPAYFPHWLEISGFIGKAKVRIIDSGEYLSIPTTTYQQLAR